MPSARTRRTIRLLASTSVIAMSLSIAPVAITVHHHGVSIVKMAQASSCFVAGTRVLMADGSEKPIEEIAIGDRVMGIDGRANRVTAIERPRLAGRPLYGFNSGRPFVTAEHPFRTLGGWKSIDPMATRSENARLRVARLAVGDMLVVAAASVGATAGADGVLATSPSVAPALQYVALRALAAAPADPETVVYNLILDGDHGYFADRFLVHNKGDGGGEGGDGGDGGSGSGSDGGEGSDGSGADGSGSGSDGGEGSDGSGSSGSGSDSGESGNDSGDDSGDDSGHSGKGSASSGQSEGRAGSFSGGLGKVGSDLSKDEEANAIANGWQ